MNKQRESVYTLRRQVLEGVVQVSADETSDTRGYLMATAEEIVDGEVELYAGKETDADSWDLGALKRELSELFAPRRHRLRRGAVRHRPRRPRSATPCGSGSRRSTSRRSEIVPAEILRRVERDLMLQIVDAQWKDHLYSLDHLKDGISLRSYGQRDPLVEYKKESYQLFQDMRSRIEAEIVRYLWWLRPVEGQPDAIVAAGPAGAAPGHAAHLQRPVGCGTGRLPAAGASRRLPATGGGAAPGPVGRRRRAGHDGEARGAEDRPQRPVLVRQRQEVQEVPRGQLMALCSAPPSRSSVSQGRPVCRPFVSPRAESPAHEFAERHFHASPPEPRRVDLARRSRSTTCCWCRATRACCRRRSTSRRG